MENQKKSSGFVRSSQAIAKAGLEESASLRRFEYVKKSAMPNFFFAVAPEVEGFEPRPIRFHRNLASLPVAGQTYNVSAECLVTQDNSDCPGCAASQRQQKQIPYESRGRDFFKIDKKKQQSQYLVVYEVTMTAAGVPVIAADAKPKLLDYRYNRRNECPDWENFIDAYEAALAQGIDPQSPNKAAVFSVKMEKEAVPGTNMMRNAYRHTVVDATVQIPSTAVEDLKDMSPLSDLFIRLDKADLQRVIEVDAAIANATKLTNLEQARAETESALDALSDVASPEFHRILDYFRKKADRNAADSVGEQVRSTSSYSTQGNRDVTSSAPPQQVEERNEQQPESDALSARERIMRIKKSREQQS